MYESNNYDTGIGEIGGACNCWGGFIDEVGIDLYCGFLDLG